VTGEIVGFNPTLEIYCEGIQHIGGDSLHPSDQVSLLG
jgi:hypothetical protein